jgi:hypothetical protein
MITIELLSKVLMTESAWVLFLALLSAMLYKDVSLQPRWFYRLGVGSIFAMLATLLGAAFYTIWYIV